MIRLGASNLAWPAEAGPRALALLAKTGVEGVEVAPTRIAPWEQLTPQHLAGFRRECNAAGVRVCSLQAVFFGKPEATLLGDEAGFAAMREHTARLADIAAALGATVAVFGAPKARLRGALSPNDAMARAADRLRTLGDIAAGGGLRFGIEPVPPVYGADFLNHAHEMLALVEQTGHPNIRAHLDTACVSLAGDDPSEAIRAAIASLAHYHMAEPDLGPFDAARLDHDTPGRTLHEVGYDGWVVIEMKQGEGDGLARLATAIAFARTHYIRA